MSVAGRPTRRVRWRLLAAVVLLPAAGLAAFAIWRFTCVFQDSFPHRPLALLVSGDTAGWLTPCGCTANQSGGLPRRATHVRRLRGRGPVLVADAGGAAAGASAYQRLKFEAILRGELAMGLDAHNLGGPEAALGADFLRDVGTRLGVPFVSANLRDDHGGPVAEPLRIVERGGRRVALAGVVSRRYAGPGLHVDDPREALLRALAAARGRYDSLVVLAYLPEDELRQLAAGLPEADAVVGGPTGQSIPPQPAGHGLLAAATNKGKFLVQLEAAAGASGWSGTVVEMGPDLDDDSAQQENVRHYLEELGRHDFGADESGLAPPAPAGTPPEYRLAGNPACVACHGADCRAWDGSHHARSWDTLKGRGYQVDPFCQQCHTNGYGLPGGFVSIRRTPDAMAVGCETCHGPSAAHVRDPRVRTAFAARDQCGRCHDHENSPKFEYAEYWGRIRHGAPATRRTARGGLP